MSKKGVSAEEKKSRMLQLFYEKGECFQLKELEKIAPKEKGIVANSVKDVVQKLVEDGLVDTDKIGSSIYFWAFPSKAVNTRKRKFEEIQAKLEESSKKLKIIEKSAEESKIIEKSAEESKESSEDKHKRNKILDEINDLELTLHESKMQLKLHQDNDPERHKLITQKAQVLKDAANRWTDNIFAVKSWCKKKFFIEDSVLNKQFGIREDFDYIE